MKVLGQRDAMFCASLARLMDKLKSIEAHDGSLLDHTVLMLGGSQISSHSGGSFPMPLAGGRKLGFNTASTKWAGAPSRRPTCTSPFSSKWDAKSFKESTGPLSEILA